MNQELVQKLSSSCDLITRASAQYNAYLKYITEHAQDELDVKVEQDLEWICRKIEHFCYDMIHCVDTVDKDYQDSLVNRK